MEADGWKSSAITRKEKNKTKQKNKTQGNKVSSNNNNNNNKTSRVLFVLSFLQELTEQNCSSQFLWNPVLVLSAPWSSKDTS